jgi:isoleucyl-tRNA synthetase
MADDAKTRDYKDTVFLPSTAFPMRGDLPKREPALLERWQKMNLYKRLREDSKGREKFILHDGPPYANGHLHIGHALNKILKDVVTRVWQMQGRDSNYVPGWDCHGLPIEWKIEEEYRAKGKDKDDVDIGQFRRECREFAEKWIDIQRTEFKRLGVEGDWDNPYLTMSYDAEAQIVREIGKFALNGALYKGSKPVMWSIVEKTALAEAEIEYQDHKSSTIHARFPIVKPSRPELAGASIVIWTTTPWTIPGNRAIAAGAGIEYVVVTVKAPAEGSMAKAGEKLVIAKALVDAVMAAGKLGEVDVGPTLTGKDLVGTLTAHPLRGQGYDFDVPVHTGDFVTTEAGTGFVHIAPGHGADDFELGTANGIAVPDTVDADGSYYAHVPLFAGKLVLKADGKPGDANGAVISALAHAGQLLAKGTLVHSYPHSWRSKAPLIFRNTPQWFISMTTTKLREVALQAISDTEWYPPSGENRIRGMIETRPDWVISRQRVWGVPIAVFVHKKGPQMGQPLRDAEVIERVAQAFEAEGADAWYTGDPQRFLGNKYKLEDFDQVKDIVDVWFDSGSTHAFVLEKRKDLQWPASMYLEGSDQHRGWFHSSLLESCGTRGRAPYEAVLTHGFVLDEQGRKMSKSLGNITAPQTVVDKLGADILRLWVVGSDYSADLRIGPEILKQQGEFYRRLRNTLRYLLGNLAGYTDAERVARDKMPELERWVLHRLYELGEQLKASIATYDFTSFYTALHNFCAVDLSSFYFDIRKDSLYCDRPDNPTRRACRTVLDEVFSCLTAWLAPVLTFTAEEAWLMRLEESGRSTDGASVHLRQFPKPPAEWQDSALAAKWAKIRELRRVVTGAIEIERAERRLGSSLQALPEVYAPAEYVAAFHGLDLAEIAITSAAKLVADAPPPGAFTLPDVAGVGVVVKAAPGEKCQRCWKVLPDVGIHRHHPTLDARCADAVEHRPG